MRGVLVFVGLILMSYMSLGQIAYKCINEQGNVLFEFKTQYVWPFSDGMAKFKTLVDINGKLEWRIGFVNEKGDITIEPIYESLNFNKYNFVDGVSWVKLPEQEGFFIIDKTGKKITDKKYAKVGSFHEGMCAVFQGLKMGFVNTKGEEIIPINYNGSPRFQDGLVCLCIADSDVDKYGFLNKEGKLVIPFQLIQTGYSGFNGGECRIQVNGKTCLIDKTGKIVFTPELTKNMKDFSCGLAKAFIRPDRTGVGFFNRNNEWVIEPIYDKAVSFVNGKTIVSINDKCGVIDTLGNFVIPLKFDDISGDCGHVGWFACQKDLIIYYYNCNGMYFTQHNVLKIMHKNQSQYYPFKDSNEKWGYLNEDGSYHIRAQYESVESFVEGKAWVY
ncbi:MAG: WG repeat-containing protein [Bacteroidales bacterium]|nr:WG repeat-containing protein [Bacteroidales bacterium]